MENPNFNIEVVNREDGNGRPWKRVLEVEKAI